MNIISKYFLYRKIIKSDPYMPERVHGGTPNDVRIDVVIDDFDKLIDYKLSSYYLSNINKYWAYVKIKKSNSERLQTVSFYKSRAKKIFDIAQRALQK